MKNTGITRSIDDLGRIVIPKEIRKSFRIKEGQIMEFYVDNDYIVLKKYDVFAESENIIKKAILDIKDDEYIGYNKCLAVINKLNEALEILNNSK